VTDETVTEESQEQQWDRSQKERAAAARKKHNEALDARAAMTPQELAQDDRKRQREAERNGEEFNAMTQEEKNKALDDPESPHYEALPPWSKRLPTGKIFDAREQRVLQLYATNGTSLEGDDVAVARKFYFEYVTATAPKKETR
jgi:hypothetical protein